MSDRQKKISEGFNDSNSFLDIGGLLKKGVDAAKSGIEKYVGWLTPKVEAAIDAAAGRNDGPLDEDVKRVANLVKEERAKRDENSSFMEEEEREVISDNRPSFVEDEGDNMMDADPRGASGEGVAGEQLDVDEDTGQAPESAEWLESANAAMVGDMRKTTVSPQSKKYIAEIFERYGIEDQGSEKANLAKAMEVAEERLYQMREK